jgi:hypothetical protein
MTPVTLRSLARPAASLVAAALAAGCAAGPTPSMDFSRPTFYAAPFPADDLRNGDGTIDLSRLPDPDKPAMITQALQLLQGAHGFGLASAIYFRMNGAIDAASLPTMAQSIAKSSSVLLVDVDAGEPDFLAPRPIDVAFLADGGPFGDANLLAILPLQGAPLRPRAHYAVVVTTAVHDAHGHAVSRAPAVDELIAKTHPKGVSDAFYEELRSALTVLPPLVANDRIAALTVFTTDDPAAQLQAVRDDAAAQHPILPPAMTPLLTDTFDDYCVYQSTVDVPDYQSGTPPYSFVGGDWKFGSDGHALFDHTETARIYITIPRAPMPATGWPTVLFVRTGAGGDRPLVDRGPAATAQYNNAVVPGTGPAMHFARVGFAGVQIDGPLGGLRNTTNGNEDFLVFNVQNAAALRDNIRESAMELSLAARMLPSLTLATPDCPGTSGGVQTIDASHLAMMGHSMGSWIEPLTLAYEHSIGTAILSGAGASYVDNVMDKLMPVAVRPYVEALLGFDQDQRTLERHDPALMIVQWAAEPSDPQVYDRLVAREPPAGAKPIDTLMLQGIVDHYILPSIANATSLALGLDEAGPAYDADNAEEKMLGQPTLQSVLPLVGGKMLTLPQSNNRGSATALVIQHPGDGIEDGHEVVFQTDPPKHQYRCFLSSWLATGVARVPPDGAADDPCQ